MFKNCMKEKANLSLSSIIKTIELKLELHFFHKIYKKNL